MKLSNVAKNSRQQFNSLAPMGQLGVTGGITGSVPQMDLFSQGAQQARQMTPKPGISGAFDSLQFERYDLPEAPDEEAYQQKKRGLKDMSWAVGLGEGVGALFKAATNFGYNPPGGRLEAGPLIMNDIRALDDEYNRAMENYRAQLAGTQAANVDLANKEMLTNDQLQREKAQLKKEEDRYQQQRQDQLRREGKEDDRYNQDYKLRKQQLDAQERQAAFQRKLAALGDGKRNNLSPYIRFALEDQEQQIMEQISAAESAGDFTKVEILRGKLNELYDVDNLKIDQNAYDLDTQGRMIYSQRKFAEFLSNTDFSDPNKVGQTKAKMKDFYRSVYPDIDPENLDGIVNLSIQQYKRDMLINGGQQAPAQGGTTENDSFLTREDSIKNSDINPFMKKEQLDQLESEKTDFVSKQREEDNLQYKLQSVNQIANRYDIPKEQSQRLAQIQDPNTLIESTLQILNEKLAELRRSGRMTTKSGNLTTTASNLLEDINKLEQGLDQNIATIGSF